MNKIGKSDFYRDFNLKGYAPLIIRKPIYFQNTKIFYPKKIQKSFDTAIVELSKTSILNANIIEKYYLLILNYKTNYPIIYLSNEGSLDFSNNQIIIDKKNRKYIIEIGTQKGITEFVIDYHQSICKGLVMSNLSDTTHILDVKYAIPITDNTIKYGTYKFETDSFCIALFDENNNGVFNENQIDRFILDDNKNAPYFEVGETSSSTLISDSICFKIKDNFYKVQYIAPQGNLVYLDKSPPVKSNYLKLFEKIPDTFYLNSDSSFAFLNQQNKAGKYFLVHLWIARSGEQGINELYEIDSLAKKYNKKLSALCLLSKSNYTELQNILKTNRFITPQGLSNKILNSELHVNGYNYNILFDKTGKVIKGIRSIKKINQYLDTHD
ncbi:MAG: hypothetical protein ACK504_05605 [Bacteroidota bacterium]